MNTVDDGGPAYPVPDLHMPNGQIQFGSYGMSLRDYFAGQAMNAFINTLSTPALAQHCAVEAYKYADAMIKARKRGGAT